MVDKSPVLDYGRPAKRTMFPWQTIVAIPLLVVFVPSTMCACGHMNTFSLLFTIPTIGLSWWGFCRDSKWSIWRVIPLIVVVFATLASLKNVADILWFGHHPLLW